MREAGPVGLDLGPRERAKLKRAIPKFDGEFAAGPQTYAEPEPCATAAEPASQYPRRAHTSLNTADPSSGWSE
jgi:hypothetical protein